MLVLIFSTKFIKLFLAQSVICSNFAMTDTSLDDFFAKKDKSRKKTKTKPESLVDIDDGKTKLGKDKKKKDKDKVNASGGLVNVQAKSELEDEEWKDFEEAKVADYSGLRIQTLQMSRDDQDKDGGDSDGGGDDDDENKDRRDGASGPWNKSSAGGPSVPTHISKPEVTPEEVTPKALTKYIPPAQRPGAVSSSAGKLPGSRKKKEAPNVHSEEDFPMLGGGPGTKKGSSQQYSSSASSDLIDNPNQRRGAGLALENKFSALQD